MDFWREEEITLSPISFFRGIVSIFVLSPLLESKQFGCLEIWERKAEIVQKQKNFKDENVTNLRESAR